MRTKINTTGPNYSPDTTVSAVWPDDVDVATVRLVSWYPQSGPRYVAGTFSPREAEIRRLLRRINGMR